MHRQVFCEIYGFKCQDPRRHAGRQSAENGWRRRWKWIRFLSLQKTIRGMSRKLWRLRGGYCRVRYLIVDPRHLGFEVMVIINWRAFIYVYNVELVRPSKALFELTLTSFESKEKPCLPRPFLSCELDEYFPQNWRGFFLSRSLALFFAGPHFLPLRPMR